MKNVVFFCLFFWMVPFFIASVRRIRDILAGPEGDTPYFQEMYRRSVRRYIFEIILFNLALLAGVALAVYAAIWMDE